MSRTRRTEPSSGCWMRTPRHIRAKRQIEQTDDALTDEQINVPHRKAIPPDDWDDLFVSTIRGQAWSRKHD